MQEPGRGNQSWPGPRPLSRSRTGIARATGEKGDGTPEPKESPRDNCLSWVGMPEGAPGTVTTKRNQVMDVTDITRARPNRRAKAGMRKSRRGGCAFSFVEAPEEPIVTLGAGTGGNACCDAKHRFRNQSKCSATSTLTCMGSAALRSLRMITPKDAHVRPQLEVEEAVEAARVRGWLSTDERSHRGSQSAGRRFCQLAISGPNGDAQGQRQPVIAALVPATDCAPSRCTPPVTEGRQLERLLDGEVSRHRSLQGCGCREYARARSRQHTLRSRVGVGLARSGSCCTAASWMPGPPAKGERSER